MKLFVSLVIILPVCQGFFVGKQSSPTTTGTGNAGHSTTSTPTALNLTNRRAFVSSVASSSVVIGNLLLTTPPANAGIDPSLLKTLPVQGDESGQAQRLRQIEAIQKPASDLVDIPFEELPSGVSFREYREGKGEAGR